LLKKKEMRLIGLTRKNKFNWMELGFKEPNGTRIILLRERSTG
jgi:hypothetical protein